MKPSPLRVGRTFCRLEPGNSRRRRGGFVASRIAVLRILLVIACYFSSVRRRRQPKLAVLRTTQGCRRRLRHWRHDGKSIGPRHPAAPPTVEGRGLRVAAVVFRLLFTMRVVADRTCNYSPRLSATKTGGRAHGFEFSFRVAAVGTTRHIPYRIERELAFLRLR